MVFLKYLDKKERKEIYQDLAIVPSNFLADIA